MGRLWVWVALKTSFAKHSPTIACGSEYSSGKIASDEQRGGVNIPDAFFYES